jgi:hypothetical protein
MIRCEEKETANQNKTKRRNGKWKRMEAVYKRNNKIKIEEKGEPLERRSEKITIGTMNIDNLTEENEKWWEGSKI